MKPRGFDARFVVVCCVVLLAGAALWLRPVLHPIRAAERTAQAAAPGSRPVPVLVELFTAEGCSSCPPADELLGKLDREQPLENARIIVLSEHVDYWNKDGWEDRFSSPEMTERQNEYNYIFKLPDVYTPQMIVDGAAQMNGTDGRAIAAALMKAATSHTIPLEITSVQVRGRDVTFTLRNGMPATPADVNVYAALVDPEDRTEVRAGENHGRTLEHTNVVRVLERIGGSWHTQSFGREAVRVQRQRFRTADARRNAADRLRAGEESRSCVGRGCVPHRRHGRDKGRGQRVPRCGELSAACGVTCARG